MNTEQIKDFGECFIAICIVLFAFATIIAWAYQGERAFEFLMRGKVKYNLFYLNFITFNFV